MGYSFAAKDLMLDALASVATHVSLHDDDPGEAGAHETEGGDPAYARQEITWGNAEDGSVAASTEPEFDVPAAAEVRFVGFWTAAEGGTFLGAAEVTPETFGAQGTYRLTAVTLDLNLDLEP